MSKNNDEWWDSYAEMRKIAKIIRDIMGWECFTSWDDYKRKYGLHEYGLGAGQAFTTPTPVAFYDGEWRVFSPDHEQLDVFDPLHNLNDAWLLLEPIKKHAHSGTAHSRFIEALKLLDRAWRHYTIAQFCEAICHAALCMLDRMEQTSSALTIYASDAGESTYGEIVHGGVVFPQREEPEKPVEITSDDQGTIEGIKEVQRLQWLAKIIEERREQPE